MAKLWPLLSLMKCIFILKFYNPLYCRISCSYTPLCVVFADQVTCVQLLWDDENVSCHCVHESQLLSIQSQTCTYIIYIAYSKLGTKGRDLSATYKSHNIYITYRLPLASSKKCILANWICLTKFLDNNRASCYYKLLFCYAFLSAIVFYFLYRSFIIVY